MGSLAIVPARSGSKGMPGKNVAPLRGKPLLAYSIEAAIDSGCFEAVMVSTDSEAYAEVARGLGADVPFLRSAEASSDSASSWLAVREALDGYAAMGRRFDSLMLLQPTSPLRGARHIQRAFEELEEKGAMTIVSVCEAEHSPAQCNTLPDDLSLGGFFRAETRGLRRQDLPAYYRFNGAIYLTRRVDFGSPEEIFGDGCYAYVMDRRSSVDIDDEVDFAIAEALMLADGSGALNA